MLINNLFWLLQSYVPLSLYSLESLLSLSFERGELAILYTKTKNRLLKLVDVCDQLLVSLVSLAELDFEFFALSVAFRQSLHYDIQF